MIHSYGPSKDPSKINIIKRKIVHLVGDGSKFCKIKVRKKSYRDKNFLQLATTNHKIMKNQSFSNKTEQIQQKNGHYILLQKLSRKNDHQMRLASI